MTEPTPPNGFEPPPAYAPPEAPPYPAEAPPPYPPYPPPYPPPYGYPAAYPAGPRPTNTFAVISMVFAFLFAPLGILFGHLSLSQIKKTGEEGRGLAIAGLVISYLVTVAMVLLITVTVVLLVAVARDMDSYYDRTDRPPVTATPAQLDDLPKFKPPATLGSNCQYPATPEPPSKSVKPPRTGKVATTPEFVNATITTNRGAIGIRLDNAKAPCTVNNFVSLAQQGFFDKTQCHRLTTSEELGVLQCGDPTGTGTGGPGYRFPNEYPTNQFRLTDPAMKKPLRYPRGTLAMANSGLGTNGSQFFLVYEDSALPPTYTVFGTINEAGLATIDKIADAGVADGSDDGKPADEVRIESVRVQ
ncbi:peptidylprolyl isomerase [Mycolicibacterium phlei]|uniref:peptidylprolyl isomerase n=1 Tax=Mycolicibacterium phlei TaxID=1771 RepID=UPI00025AE6FE|nr:peptidylprolyl isomerase [Mycolicibacterium phlei]EID11021.1 peptidyl-prolyl cis-trans isomerase [Mycolicibacterium phlei RIVM601174]MBF4190441.1 peptidyl-prolyl cis-trans isomerase [Mycolicibacterium phlei]